MANDLKLTPQKPTRYMSGLIKYTHTEISVLTCYVYGSLLTTPPIPLALFLKHDKHSVLWSR